MEDEFEAGGGGERFGIGLLAFVLIVLCFYLLGHTADAYFTPALQVLWPVGALRWYQY
jgi:hypothetical protein